MAAKWERFAQDGDRYNLQYRTIGDDRVREEHAGLDGITLPIDDPFWHTYYPPNGWNCRCTVVQVLKDKYEVTPHSEAMAMGEAALQTDSKGIFRFNSGIQQKAVPDYNPYTVKRCNHCDIAKGKLSLAFVPDNELCAACKLVHSCWTKKKDNIPERYYKCETENGELRVSSKHGKTEKKENVRIGRYLANKYGYKIDLIENPSNVKSADSYNHTLGITQEYKVNSTPTRSSIDNLIRKGAKQSENIVLVIDSNLSMLDLSNALNDRVKRTSIKNITIIIDDKDKTYSFEEITANGFLIKKADLK